MRQGEQKKQVPAIKRVFIVEDHPESQEGLAQIFKDAHDMAVCGAASHSDKALETICRLEPDLVLVDVAFARKRGLALIKKIRLANTTVKVLAVSTISDARSAASVLRAGGNGYISRQEDPEEIIQAIRDVLNGFIYVSESVSNPKDLGTAVEAPRPRRCAAAF